MTTKAKLAYAPLALSLWMFLGNGLRAQTSPDASLLLHFDFDEDLSNEKVVDVTGNGHDGWNMQSTNWIIGTNGTFGSRAGFWYTNGTTDISEPLSTYLAVTNVSGLTNMTNLTIAVWTRTDPTYQQSTMVIVSSGYDVAYSGDPADCANSWDLRRVYSSNFKFLLYSAYGNYNLLDFPDDVVSPGGSMNLSQTNWHHYVATVDTVAHSVVGYHDGVAFQTNFLIVPYLTIYGGPSMRWMAVGAGTHAGVPQWGNSYSPNDSYFAGQMDDLRIYNRILSAGEVLALYNGSIYARNLTIQNSSLGSVQLSWDANTNLVYQVESVTNLAGANWSGVGAPIPGTETNTITDSTLNDPARFYRVRVLP